MKNGGRCKIKIGAGAFFMAVAMLLSERADVFLLYGAVAVLHELGHLAAARLRGIAVREIRLDVSGARICAEEGELSYADELILCLSGPLVNMIIVVWGVFAAAARGISAEELTLSAQSYIFGGEPSAMGACTFFVMCAAIQGFVNLLPIRTLDGGRVLYCLCAMVFSQRAADRVLSVSGAMCAFVLWTVALFLMIKWGLGLGIYVFCACLFFGTLRDRELVGE